EAGATLAAHHSVNHVTFTGSVKTGISVGQAATANVVPVTLELGGKSPNIVFPDCDIDKTVDGVVKAISQNNSQTCSAGSRLLVEETFKEQFLEKLVQKFKALTIGPGKEDYDVGPILNQQQFHQVMHYLEMAKQEGTIRTGGSRVNVDHAEGGYYLEPTIIDNISMESEIAQEEIFGPILTVFSFKDDEEALEMANDTAYGLV